MGFRHDETRKLLHRNLVGPLLSHVGEREEDEDEKGARSWPFKDFDLSKWESTQRIVLDVADPDTYFRSVMSSKADTDFALVSTLSACVFE